MHLNSLFYHLKPMQNLLLNHLGELVKFCRITTKVFQLEVQYRPQK